MITKLGAWLCILAGLGLLAFTGYRAWDPLAGDRQHAAQQRLYHSWGTLRASAQAPAGRAGACQLTGHPDTGQVFAIIRIPALGHNWKFTVIQGAGLPQLATGPGHVPGTALPGQQGNVGIAAHDVTAGNPFLHLADLKPGDRIIITTRSCVITYQVTRPSFRVWYTDVSVLNPTRAHTITLITCWPVNVLYFVPHRTIVQGTEVSSVGRAP